MHIEDRRTQCFLFARRFFPRSQGIFPLHSNVIAIGWFEVFSKIFQASIFVEIVSPLAYLTPTTSVTASLFARMVRVLKPL
jgi:hypothetical protein